MAVHTWSLAMQMLGTCTKTVNSVSAIDCYNPRIATNMALDQLKLLRPYAFQLLQFDGRPLMYVRQFSILAI